MCAYCFCFTNVYKLCTDMYKYLCTNVYKYVYKLHIAFGQGRWRLITSHSNTGDAV